MLRGIFASFRRIRLSSWVLIYLLPVSCAVMQPVQSRGGDSYIVVDLHSKKILLSKGAEQKRQVASLTKVATAMVVLDWAELTKADLGSWISVPESVRSIGGANPLGLMPGDQITMRDALYSSIIGSDNVAAQTLASHVGQDVMRRQGKRGDPLANFVAQMNALAKNNGCKGTRFTNPHGLDHARPVPYSTAADMARLAMYAMRKASFTYYCSQKERKVEFRRAGQPQRFLVKNTNQLLGRDSIDGVKTGMTGKAGQCLITSATRPSTVQPLADGRKRVIPHRLVVVVLGSSDRFGQSLHLLKEGWLEYDGWAAVGRPIGGTRDILLTIP